VAQRIVNQVREDCHCSHDEPGPRRLQPHTVKSTGRHQCARLWQADRSGEYFVECLACGTEKHSQRALDFTKVFKRIDTQQAPVGQFSSTGIRLCPLRPGDSVPCSHRGLHLIATMSFALKRGGRHGRSKAERPTDSGPQTQRHGRRRIPWHHRDRVVRTLRRTIKAADTGRCVNLDVAVLVAIDRSGRTPRQALGIFTVQTHLRQQHLLVLLLATCTGRLI